MNGTVRAGRAEVLAGAAADAAALVHGGYLQGCRIVRILGNHHDGSDRAVAGAVAAGNAVAFDDAQAAVDRRRTDVEGRLLLRGEGLDGTGGADLGALDAFGAAVAAFITHLRLHEMRQVHGRTQHVVRAVRDAELAGRAAVVKVFDAVRSERGQGRGPLRNLLVQDGSQTAVAGRLGAKRGGRRGQGGGGDEGAAALIGRLRGFGNGFRGGRSRGLPIGEAVFHCSELAVVQAVEAVDAAAVIDLLVVDIDAGSLAFLLADMAALAFFGIDDRTQEGEAGEKTEGRADRAHGVAVGTSADPGKDGDDQEGHGRDDDGPDGGRGDGGAEHASVGAVRGQQGDEDLDAGDEGDDEQHPDAIAEPFHLLLELEAHFLAFALAAQPGNDVLVDAHRADDRAVDTAENEGEEDQQYDNADIDGEYGRQELELGHPAEPLRQFPGDPQEEEGNGDEENGCQDDTGFLQHIVILRFNLLSACQVCGVPDFQR